MNAIHDDKTTSEQLEALCRFYAATREDLRKLMADLKERIRQVSEAMRPELLASLDYAVNARSQLEAFVAKHPELFESPRTQQLHSIKVGFRKLPGSVDIDNEARTIELIREKLPDRAEQLIRVTEAVRKDAVRELSARDLASIGCTVREVGDDVVVKATETDLDRLIKAVAGEDTFSADMLAKTGAV